MTVHFVSDPIAFLLSQGYRKLGTLSVSIAFSRDVDRSIPAKRSSYPCRQCGCWNGRHHEDCPTWLSRNEN
jgi:hypothetical protein